MKPTVVLMTVILCGLVSTTPLPDTSSFDAEKLEAEVAYLLKALKGYNMLMNMMPTASPFSAILPDARFLP